MTIENPPPNGKGALRARRYRARRRDAVRLAMVDIQPTVIAAMIEERLLGEHEAADPQKLGAAVADLVECWAEGRLISRLLRHAVTAHQIFNHALGVSGARLNAKARGKTDGDDR